MISFLLVDNWFLTQKGTILFKNDWWWQTSTAAIRCLAEKPTVPGPSNLSTLYVLTKSKLKVCRSSICSCINRKHWKLKIDFLNDVFHFTSYTVRTTFFVSSFHLKHFMFRNPLLSSSSLVIVSGIPLPRNVFGSTQNKNNIN